jgi:hypothetical protein
VSATEAAADVAVYERLAELAERELAIVCAFEPRRIDELLSVIEERDALVAMLPERPPALARPALARAFALQQRTTATLTRLRSELGRSLSELERARRAARGYGMQVRRPARLDRTG